MLPQDFSDRMKEMLGEDYPAFLASYETERAQALRLNALKTEKETFLKASPFFLTPVPWASDGFYYDREDMPGKHPYHEAGVYYIQEPSAMAPVEYLMRPLGNAEKETAWTAADRAMDRMTVEESMAGERILDLCAAPGGKSTQIAAFMRGKGILVCNEIHPARAKILSENVERMGICNAMVTNETPRRLAENFSDYFTRILVDAPCSGEGMFRKNEEACEEWSPENVELCAARQDDILDCAASMLAPGGRLVYSTCTFAPAENEGSICRFLKRHPEFRIEEVPLAEGMAHAVPAWYEKEQIPAIAHTIRLWPHRLKGEGHYLAVLRRAGKLCYDALGYLKNGQEQGIPERELRTPGKGCVEYLEFAGETLRGTASQSQPKYPGRYLKFGEQLYLFPGGMPSVKGLKVLRPGLHLGTMKKNRFEPSHALALAMKPEDCIHTVDLTADSREIRAYLNGETFPAAGEKGWYLVTVDGYSIGWGKLAGGILKNHYPKGLRKNISL